ncbi:Short chain dehydrogenase [Tetragenococcus halophilus subsp. halophilus]|uniref:D-threitol dehydrogenase n=1 Tax=Tetragenococcus halophilus TaxID=51669 RepID=A0AB35HP14_TETHA|nr:D-threitol dehydrogenase [Tetragenococcus halophilus]MDN6571396.1 D-threitol dehydrogenase [Staphylococcus equorum]MCO7026390.1 D-threitol dehydrogenase [Tetragenococcus halophilus]MCO8290922.1 D-threitol dehydrogenase [Tetragenococcus halophilus]MCO8296446.1 D-threitol dehydrogenase [Tetragenococcus halophilus]MCO8297922.1 D-threitol dehydrogenase [Tetragenococcus halophilus]
MDFQGFDKDFNLTGKVAVITGGSSGIGRAISELYSEKGAKVALLDVKDAVDEDATTIDKNNAIGIKTDVTNKISVQKALNKVKDTFGKVDIVVNCAGVALLEKAKDISEEDWDKTIDLNLKGTFLMNQIFGNELIDIGNGGKIINMASQGGIVALDKHIAYNTSKAGIIMMSKVLAMEWAEYNIQVNAISPTVIMTELGKKAWAGEVGENMKEQIPARRFGEPEEVAGVALFLASDAANLITGENIVIDGGYTIQ